jgi:hypothetical protein
MDFQDERGLASDRLGVIADVRLVRRAHFAKTRAACFEDLRDAEAAADLQQLAAGDDDLRRSVLP